MTKLNLNDAELEAIHGGAELELNDPDSRNKPAKVNDDASQGNLGGGGVDTDTVQQDPELPGA